MLRAAPLLVCLFVFCGLTAGCKKSEPSGNPVASSSQPGSVAESKGTIGFSALTLTNPFFKVIADTMTEAAKENGYKLLVVAGERDVKKQADQIDDFIVKGVSAIVLNPCDSRSIGPAIKRANEAGIPVFTNDLGYDGDDAEVVCHIATDNFQGGTLAGQAMVKAIGDAGGKVTIIDFKQAESCQLRVAGFKKVVAEHNAKEDSNKIEIVMELEGGGMTDEGFKAAKDAIETHPDLAAFFAINDPSALGAYSALDAAGKTDQVTIIGFDGQLSGKQAILEGKILCDPIQFPDQIGKITIEKIIAHFNGDDVEREVLIPSALYYKADAEKELGGSGPVDAPEGSETEAAVSE